MDCFSVICLSSFFITVEGGYQRVVAPPRGEYHIYDRNNASPYLGAFSIGLKKELNSQWTWSAYYRHESMPTLPDMGVDAVWLTTEWRPFK
jgi:hypothetical protein